MQLVIYQIKKISIKLKAHNSESIIHTIVNIAKCTESHQHSVEHINKR